MILTPVSKGNASITLSKAAVRRYGDAANVLSSTTNGSYAITGAYKSSSVLGAETKDVSKNGFYSVFLNISSKGDKPVSDATVILNPVSKKEQKKATTNNKGTVHFSDVKSGIYSVIVEQKNNKVGESIINVSGSNHVLTLGINLDAQKNNPLMKNTNSILNTLSTNPLLLIAILIVGVVAGVGIALLIIRIKGKK